MRYLKFLLICAIILVRGATTDIARGAEFLFDSRSGEIGLGQEFRVDVILDTQGQNINAVEGSIRFPQDLLELKDVNDANSVVALWVKEPRRDAGPVYFSGITPGGYQGEAGLLVSLTFVAKSEGQGSIYIEQGKTLLNDGQGTDASLTIRPFQFTISSNIQTLPPVLITDKESPESFLPAIARDPVTWGGKWFLAFSTQDKGAGLDHFEIKEVRQEILAIFSPWQIATSPYVLQDQELRSNIFVKAVDKKGNERTEKISPRYPLSWYENITNWSIIVLILAAGAVLSWKFLWNRRITT